MTDHAKRVTQPDFQEFLTDAFRRQVGRNKPDKVCAIAAETGTDDSLWKQVQASSKTPSMVTIMNAASAMQDGEAFMNDVLAPFGFTGVRRLEDSGEVTPLGIASELSQAVDFVIQALDDGVFDDDESAELARRLKRLSRRGDRLRAVK